MTIDRNLFLSILALDSYNRGSNPEDLGLVLSEDKGIGLATVLSPISNVPGKSFYAVAYEWNGETILSYRGTDNPYPVSRRSDFWQGWSVGAGFNVGQAPLALEF